MVPAPAAHAPSASASEPTEQDEASSGEVCAQAPDSAPDFAPDLAPGTAPDDSPAPVLPQYAHKADASISRSQKHLEELLLKLDNF